MELLLIAAALFLAFGNGANDNFKGFATVWGSESLSYRQALWLATAATLAGSLLSVYLAHGLVQQFSGKGLLPQALVAAPEFITSVSMGAALTVLLATRVGLPISTTHALIGGLIGAGLAASPGEVRFAQLGQSFVLPLLFSPIMAAGAGWGVYRLVRRRQQARRQAADCACVVAQPLLGPAAPSGAAMAGQGMPTLVVASAATCDTYSAYAPPLGRWSIGRLLDRLHLGSATLICFARAVNDTPKLAALLVAGQLLPGQWSLGLIALAMGVGGLLLSRRVAETMSLRVAQLDASRGLSANLITATLVLGASQFGLPVSTTHVSVGAIAGVGAGGATLNTATLRGVLLSWVATLPLAAGAAWVVYPLL